MTLFQSERLAPLPSPPAIGSQGRWLAVAVAFIAILAFSPILGNSFILVDDQATVQNNPDFTPPASDRAAIRDSSREGAGKASSWSHYWTGPTLEQYIPLTYTLWGVVSFAAQTSSDDGVNTGLSPAIYHAVSLLLHALNAVLVLLILRKLVAGIWPAFFGALLFAVHPLQTEAVAWVSQTSILLSSVFSFWAILEFLTFTDRRFGLGPRFASASRDASALPATATGGWFHYSLGTLALALALLSHPAAALTPILVLVIELILRRRPWKAVLGPPAIWVLMCVPIVILTHHWQAATYPLPWSQRSVVAADALAFYLYKFLLPIGLLANYGRSPGWLFANHSVVAWTWAGPVALALVSLLMWRKARWVVAAALLFAVAVVPGMGLNFLGFQRFSTTSDHYVYVAMLGAALALACLIAREPRPMTFVAAALLLAFVAALSFRQATDWLNTGRLFTRVIDVQPDNRDGQELVARAYEERSREDLKDETTRRRAVPDMVAARDHFLIAAGLPGDAGISYYNAASCELSLGHFDAAMKNADRALLDPKFPLQSSAYMLKGAIEEKQLDQLDAAGDNYKKALGVSRNAQDSDAALLALRGLALRRVVGSKGFTQPAN